VLQLRAQVVQTAAAHHALATGHEWLNGNAVTGRDMGHSVPNLNHLANQFVAQHLPGDARQDLRHAPGYDVDVAAANTGNRCPDQHFSGSGLRRRDLPDLKQARFNKDCGTHWALLSGFLR
jgi:hypothetical protein